MDDWPPSNFWGRWAWLCPVVSVVLAAWLLAWYGLTWWSALLLALLLACPATLLWGALLPVWDAWRARRRRQDADDTERGP